MARLPSIDWLYVFTVAARSEARQATAAVAHIEPAEKRLWAALDLPPISVYSA
jgi:hypothetical protein